MIDSNFHRIQHSVCRFYAKTFTIAFGCQPLKFLEVSVTCMAVYMYVVGHAITCDCTKHIHVLQ